MFATVNLFLDTRRIKKTGKFPVKLRVTFDRKPQYYQTKFDLTAEEFDKLSSPRLVGPLKEVKDKVKEIQRKAEEVALGLDPFMFENFEKDYVLENPLFHQRKNLKEAMVKASYEFDASQYANRFPIFKLPTPEDKKPNNYIFPVLEHGITPLRQIELIELFVQSLNDWMFKIRKKLGIEKKVTTYVARHTFSTVMKRSGISTEFIREALGHTNIRTTENYLDSFEKEMKKEYASRLLAFKSRAEIEQQVNSSSRS